MTVYLSKNNGRTVSYKKKPFVREKNGSHPDSSHKMGSLEAAASTSAPAEPVSGGPRSAPEFLSHHTNSFFITKMEK